MSLGRISEGSPAVAVSEGMEEETLHTMSERAKLYRWVEAESAKGWEARGKGHAQFLRSFESGITQLRQEGVCGSFGRKHARVLSHQG